MPGCVAIIICNCEDTISEMCDVFLDLCFGLVMLKSHAYHEFDPGTKGANKFEGFCDAESLITPLRLVLRLSLILKVYSQISQGFKKWLPVFRFSN